MDMLEKMAFLTSVFSFFSVVDTTFSGAKKLDTGNNKFTPSQLRNLEKR